MKLNTHTKSNQRKNQTIPYQNKNKSVQKLNYKKQNNKYSKPKFTAMDLLELALKASRITR